MTVHDLISSQPESEPETVIELLRWRAQRQPDRRAYTFLSDRDTPEASLTYQALDHRARTIAGALQQAGLAGERALMLYPPGLDYIAAFFGCLYADVVAVPAYPPSSSRLRRADRLQGIVHDAQPKIILTTTDTQRRIAPLLTELAADRSLQIQTTDDLAAALADTWQAPMIDGQALAFLQYTSGSTAAPKGVMVTHRNLLHNQRLIQHAFQQTSAATIVGWLPLYHDMGLIGTVLHPLYLGAACVLMSPVTFLQQPIRWLEAIAHYRATASGGPNFAYELCVRKIAPEQRATLDLSSWQVAFNGAEPVRQETIDRFAAAFEPCGFRREAFAPCYGLAEATLLVTGSTMGAPPVERIISRAALEHGQIVGALAEEPGSQSLVGSGQAHPDMQVMIVDPETQRPAAPNCVGEIWVAGPSVARGYWQRPEETARTFQASLDGGGPYLRTGDLGFMADDELFITGRLKDLIIIRGRNHYPQDIELTAERSHPALRPNAGAAFTIDVDNQERLVVVQEVAREHRQTPVEQIAVALRQAVAQEHEIPVYAVALIKPGALPKTSSGKIQRQATRAAFLSGSLDLLGTSTLDELSGAAPVQALDREMLLCGSPDERRMLLEGYLRQQAAHILQIDPDRLDLETPLVALGLDSLMAVELQHQLEADLDVRVPSVELVEGLSVATLADDVLGQLADDAPLFAPIPRATTVGGQYPLSAEQQRLWLLDQLEPHSAALNLAVAYQLTGPLDLAVLQQSLNAIVARHAALRTVFRTADGQPVQEILPRMSLPVMQIDLRDVPDPEQEARQLADDEAQRPFDLGRGPLLRVTLLRTADQTHRLLFTAHHIVCDFWSMAVLLHELTTLYAAHSSGQRSPLAELPVQYPDVVAWQRLQQPGDAQLAYWKQRLTPAPTPLPLPGARPRSGTPRGAHQPFALSPALSTAVYDFSRRAGVTPFMTLLAAFNTLLHRYTHHDDIVVGSPIAGRVHPDVQQLIGFFAYPLVLRTDLSGQPTFSDVLARVRETALEAYAHQDVPFAKVVEVARPPRSGRQVPLFQVMFGFLGKPISATQAGPLTFGGMEIVRPTTDLDLFLTMFAGSDALHGTLSYNAEQFESAAMEQFLAAFQATLEQAVAQPERPIATFELPIDAPAASEQPQPQQTIAISASFTAEPIEEVLAFWLRELDLSAGIAFAPYNQIFQQLLDPTSLLSQNERGLNVVLLRIEDWLRFVAAGAASDPATTRAHLERQIDDLIGALRAAGQRSPLPYLLCVCPSAPQTLADPQRAALFSQLEDRLVTALASERGIYVVTPADLARSYPVADYADPHADELGHIPYTRPFFAALGTSIVRRLYALQSAPHKVIVLDCDQLLWRGVCGEDGPLGVTIDPPRQQLQEFMRAQHDAGMLLCLCSQNNEADVRAVFEQRPEMPLKLEHFVSWRINWQPKSDNIRALAQELQLGLESFIFIDDDPVQCAEVQVGCPEVLTLQLPADVERAPGFLEHVWAFDQLKTTAEDRKRTTLYRQNIEREQLQARALTLADFIAGLDLHIDIQPLSADQVARVAQLTQRTNQFNLTTIRRSESEIQQLLDGDQRCFTVQVRDRFGDYGLVGVMIVGGAGDALAVDSFLLSCRALGRGVEYAMLRHLGQTAQAHGLTHVNLRYVPTKKNQPAHDFVERVGGAFKQAGDGQAAHYRFPVAVAAQLTYAAAGADAQEPAQPGPDIAPSGAADQILAKSARLTRIATELYTVDQTLAAMRSQTRAQPDLAQLQQAIEGALREHPAVEQALVVPGEHTAGQLVAYVVPERRHAPTINGRPRYKLPNNMAVAYQNQYEAFLTYKEVFEDMTYLRHGITINDGDCIVDLGANIGLFSLFVQHLRPQTRVYAFEPSPPVFEALRINTMLYGPNVEVFNQGVSDATKTATFTFYPRASAISGYFADPAQDEMVTRALMLRREPGASTDPAALEQQVDELLKEGFQSQSFVTQLRSLSDIIREQGIERIDLLKIDVEKSEMDVLHGIAPEDWPKIKQIVMEVHHGFLEPVSQLLREHGFEFAVEQEGLVQETDFYYMLYALRPAAAAALHQPAADDVPATLPALDRTIVSVAELRRWIREQRPEAASKLPHLVLLEALPRSSDGALDYAALPAPDLEADAEDGFVAPRTPTESAVAAIWSELLGLERVSVRDDFFELGGHSLLATQILAQVRQDLDVDLPMKVLFTDTFTIEELAKAIDQYRIEQADVDDAELSMLLQELEGLSDEEIRLRLADEDS